MEEHRIQNIMEDAPVETVAEAPQELEAKPAGVAERFIALLIDWSIISIPYQLLAAFVINRIQPDLEIIYAILGCVIIPFILYETIFGSGGRNTLGKALVGIRVADVQTGEPLPLPRAFIRAVGYLISAGLLMCGFLLAFIDNQHRALHDYLAGSVVMQARPKSWGERTALTLTGALLMIVFVSVSYSQLFGAGSLAQQRLINRAQEHLAKIGYLEEVHRMHFGYYTNDLLRLSILSGDPVQFQRDTHAVLDNRNFRIGVSENGYKISAQAKDAKKTKVYYPG